MRVTAVLHDPGLLAQSNALLRPSLSRGLIRGPGQQKVLDSRQNVRDLALAIDQFNECLKWLRTVRSLERTGNMLHPESVSVYAGHLQPGPKSRAKFQLVLQSQGNEQTTDLAFTAGHVGRLGVEASAQGLGLTDLMSQVLTQALKKGLIQKILDKK